MIRLFRSRELPGETQAPVIEQVRHELRMRRLRVKDRQQLTPNMIRIVLEGDDLKGFTSQSPDDHVKVFLPQVSGEPAKRDYTPRRFDAQNNELTLDFAVHDAGPATAWAMLAQPGGNTYQRGDLIIITQLFNTPGNGRQGGFIADQQPVADVTTYLL